MARPGRLTTTSSPGCSIRTGAIAARSRRRARFRLTAPVAPGTAKATRDAADSPGSARTRTAPERASLPVSRTDAIRRRPGRRCRRFIASEPSQALAALTTACLEHLAPAWRRHTYAKAVRLAPVALLGLVRPLDGRLPETWIASGALWAPLSPTGLRREYTKAAVDRPSSRKLSSRDHCTVVRSLRL